jgi:hypothetical protein
MLPTSDAREFTSRWVLELAVIITTPRRGLIHEYREI